MSDPTARTLRLLDLLQARPLWSGASLATKLGVSGRTVRRDVDRLRELGYPVEAERGPDGGYRLGAGRALPPLLLSDEEAVALAVSLRLGAGGTVAGVSEAALRTLAKIDQVLPTRLRAQVGALNHATVTLPDFGVDPQVDQLHLMSLARACRDQVRVRFGYQAGDDASTRRDVEPYSVVVVGRRWYLLAWDVDRDDWRTFRIDRVGPVHTTTFQFSAREAPDAAAYVQRSVTTAPYRHVLRVVIAAPAGRVRPHVPARAGVVTELDDSRCAVEGGGDSLRWMAWHVVQIALAAPGPLVSIEPEELRTEMALLGKDVTAMAG